MGQGGRRVQRLPLGAMVRPLLMLVLGIGAGFALWRLLMLEPGVTPGARSPGSERLTRGDRAALERLLHDGPPRSRP